MFFSARNLGTKRTSARNLMIGNVRTLPEKPKVILRTLICGTGFPVIIVERKDTFPGNVEVRGETTDEGRMVELEADRWRKW